MANTYTLISSNVLSSAAYSVTLSSIPNTYTDLVLKCTTRDDTGGANGGVFNVTVNGDGSTKYSKTLLQGLGSTTASVRGSNETFFELGYGYMNSGGNTTNTFSSIEVYFPNYTSTSSRPISGMAFGENNSTTAYRISGAGLYRGTSAISSITLAANYQFSIGSSFYLYGIKNS